MSTLVATRLSTMLRQTFRVIALGRCAVRCLRFPDSSLAEGVTKTELLAIRFGTPENAALFKV
jgi:hypothetical protein